MRVSGEENLSGRNIRQYKWVDGWPSIPLGNAVRPAGESRYYKKIFLQDKVSDVMKPSTEESGIMAATTLEKLSILLVEPSTAQQKIIKQYLTRLGNSNLNTVVNGSQALEAMGKQLPELVISAMHLDGMSGTELVLTMRMESRLRDIPFMLISSETHFRYLEPIRQAGVIAILPKPFTLEQLKTALDSTIQFIDPGEIKIRHFHSEELVVLVVDDSFTARRHIARVLNNMGIENIIEAENGKVALEILNDRYFDLVVTDYNMPVMDGQEFVAEIRKHSHQASIPILMVSSETDQSRLAAVQQVGVSAICDKPFDSKVVKELLQRIII